MKKLNYLIFLFCIIFFISNNKLLSQYNNIELGKKLLKLGNSNREVKNLDKAFLYIC